MATREKKHREMQQAWRFVFSEIRCEMQQVTISQYILRVLSSVSHGFSSAKTVPEMVRKMWSSPAVGWQRPMISSAGIKLLQKMPPSQRPSESALAMCNFRRQTCRIWLAVVCPNWSNQTTSWSQSVLPSLQWLAHGRGPLSCPWKLDFERLIGSQLTQWSKDVKSSSARHEFMSRACSMACLNMSDVWTFFKLFHGNKMQQVMQQVSTKYVKICVSWRWPCVAENETAGEVGWGSGAQGEVGMYCAIWLQETQKNDQIKLRDLNIF